MAFGFPPVLAREHKPVDVLFIIVAVYILGLAVSIPAETLLQDLVARRWLGNPPHNAEHF